MSVLEAIIFLICSLILFCLYTRLYDEVMNLKSILGELEKDKKNNV